MNKIERILSMIPASRRAEAEAILKEMPDASTELTNYVTEEKAALNTRITDDVLACIAECAGYNLESLQMKLRKRELVEARQMFCFVMRIESTLSLSDIARILKRDHATVIHGVKQMTGLIGFNSHNRRLMNCVLDEMDKRGYTLARGYVDKIIGQVRMKREV